MKNNFKFKKKCEKKCKTNIYGMQNAFLFFGWGGNELLQYITSNWT